VLKTIYSIIISVIYVATISGTNNGIW